nr:uncharacterized protein LOC117847948 [Setaria viridis]
MYVDVERVRKAKANTLRREFDALKFRDGESVDDFSIRISRIVHQLVVLNDGCTEEEIVRKFLQALPPKYGQIAMSIETLLDLSEVSVEELIGRLKSAEERHDLGGGSGSIAKLNLTKDELVARIAAKMQISGEGSLGHSRGSSSSQRRGRAASVAAHVEDPDHPRREATAVRRSPTTSAGTVRTRATRLVNAARRNVMLQPT